ncbi:hypothetical protein C8F01DRAFT_1075422 [Mycena amicta]|nr:hypothetical protein C8F01DRAFT_1075422 [Mycena amicta]
MSGDGSRTLLFFSMDPIRKRSATAGTLELRNCQLEVPGFAGCPAPRYLPPQVNIHERTNLCLHLRGELHVTSSLSITPNNSQAEKNEDEVEEGKPEEIWGKGKRKKKARTML